MGAFSIWQWLIVLAIILLLFGTGRIAPLMGEMAKGLKAFRKGMADDPDEAKDAANDTSKTVEHKAEEAVETVKETAKKS
ncbi:MAG: twin-arginine translocase TatA/TatE family subunit [Pseudomonadota bacterium]